MLLATDEHYKEFLEGIIWQDLMIFFEECIEVNRDLLEGIKGFREGAKVESDDALRGRNWQIRDIIAYVNERASIS
jgi:hypothetical protein